MGTDKIFWIFKKDNLILDDQKAKKRRAKMINVLIIKNSKIPMTHVGKGQIL